MASLKTKGDLAELKVAADLVERGYRIAIPFGEDNDFDLILIRGGQLERVQVKYTECVRHCPHQIALIDEWKGAADEVLHV
jgi:hypothetical protein